MILEGTTSSGAVVPVQVTTDGKVVAEGRTGPEGPQGPEGPEGPQGPEGPAGAPGNLWSGSDPGPIYYTGGSVGIGTTSPGYKLHVVNDSSAAARIGGTNNYLELGEYASSSSPAISYNGSGVSLPFRNGTTEVARFDSLGRLLVGTSSYTDVGNGATLQVKGNGAAASSMSLIRTAAGGPEFHFAAGSSGVNIGNNQGLGFCKFLGYHTNGYDEYARIQAFVDGSNGDGDAPGRLVFSTSGPGSATPTERMRIDSQGDVIFQGAPIIRSPDGTHWAIEVDNTGNLSAIQAF